MKKYIVNQYALPFLILIFLLIDRQLYFYGNCLLMSYDGLPFKLRPEYGWTGKSADFFIQDEYKESIISQGDVYRGYPQIEVYKLLGYGFNSKNFIGHFIDSKNGYYYIHLKEKFNGQVDNDYSIELIKSINNIENKELKWIDVSNSNQKPKLLTVTRLILLVCILSSVFILFVSKVNQPKKTNL